MVYHVLFNTESGPVQSCDIEAESLAACEALLQEQYPTAAYWEIGVPDD